MSYVLRRDSNCHIWNELLQLGIDFVNNLICSPFNSKDGINICVEAPFSRNHNLNTLRPAVLRQYFGADSYYSRNHKYISRRFSYGVGHGSAVSSVGSDIDNVITRKLDGNLLQMSTLIAEIVYKRMESRRNLVDLRYRHKNKVEMLSFNHCSILLYYSIGEMKHESVLSKHCDCTYGKDSKFINSANSQTEDTITASFSICDSRVVKFFVRSLVKDNSKKGGLAWKENEECIKEIQLNHGDVMVVHPHDERPFRHNDVDGNLLRQILHGEVKVKDGQFSIGFVFRNVSSVKSYFKHSNRLINALSSIENKDCDNDNYDKVLLNKPDLKSNEEYHALLRKGYMKRMKKYVK